MKILHILSSSRGLDTFPSVYNSIYLMAENGIQISIATASSKESFPFFIDKKIFLTDNFFLNAFCMASIINQYDYVVVYEPVDLELIGFISKLISLKTTVFFHSLEIPFYQKTDLKKNNSILKFLQNISLRKGFFFRWSKFFLGKKLAAKLLFKYFYNQGIKKDFFLTGLNKSKIFLIQDLVRLNAFNKAYELKNTRSFLIPNSYINVLEKQSSPWPLVDKINRDSRKKILYVGSLEAWALSKDLIDKVVNLKNYLWIFSGWSRDNFVSNLGEYVNFNNVIINIAQYSVSDLNTLVSACDIGLCFYTQRENENIRCMGMSSGKYHKFLLFEKPVLVSKGFVGLSDFTQEHGFGEEFELDELDLKVKKIEKDYQAYVQNIRKDYLKLCSYEDKYLEFIRYLKGRIS